MKKTLLILLLSILSGQVIADLNNGLNAYMVGDYKTAYKDWLPIAEQGNAVAQYNLAGLFVNGYGVDLDEEIAFKWYKKAAEQGHPKAQFNLGVMYLIESGTEQSFVEAKHWLHLAYENGIEESEDIWNEYKLWNH